MAGRPPPRFTGVATYRDPRGRFSFRYPTDWHRFDLEGEEGVLFCPGADEPHTGVSAWARPLEHAAVAEDLDVLRRGVAAGLAELRDCTVESASDVVLGNLIKLERIYAFTEGGARRKRKLWLHYVDVWQVALTWQGASEAEYDYWLAMANASFESFSIPEALWFATDRGLLKTPRGPDPPASP